MIVPSAWDIDIYAHLTSLTLGACLTPLNGLRQLLHRSTQLQDLTLRSIALEDAPVVGPAPFPLQLRNLRRLTVQGLARNLGLLIAECDLPGLSALEIHVGWQEDPVDFATAFTRHLSNVTSLAMSGPTYIPSLRVRVHSTLSDFSTLIPNIVNLDLSHATEVVSPARATKISDICGNWCCPKRAQDFVEVRRNYEETVALGPQDPDSPNRVAFVRFCHAKKCLLNSFGRAREMEQKNYHTQSHLYRSHAVIVHDLGFVLHFDIAAAHQARSKKNQQIATAQQIKPGDRDAGGCLDQTEVAVRGLLDASQSKDVGVALGDTERRSGLVVERSILRARTPFVSPPPVRPSLLPAWPERRVRHALRLPPPPAARASLLLQYHTEHDLLSHYPPSRTPDTMRSRRCRSSSRAPLSLTPWAQRRSSAESPLSVFSARAYAHHNWDVRHHRHAQRPMRPFPIAYTAFSPPAAAPTTICTSTHEHSHMSDALSAHTGSQTRSATAPTSLERGVRHPPGLPAAPAVAGDRLQHHYTAIVHHSPDPHRQPYGKRVMLAFVVPHAAFVASPRCATVLISAPLSPLDARACCALQYHPQHVPRLRGAPWSFLIAGAAFVAFSSAHTIYCPGRSTHAAGRIPNTTPTSPAPVAAALHRAHRIIHGSVRTLPFLRTHPHDSLASTSVWSSGAGARAFGWGCAFAARKHLAPALSSRRTSPAAVLGADPGSAGAPFPVPPRTPPRRHAYPPPRALCGVYLAGAGGGGGRGEGGGDVIVVEDAEDAAEGVGWSGTVAIGIPRLCAYLSAASPTDGLEDMAPIWALRSLPLRTAIRHNSFQCLIAASTTACRPTPSDRARALAVRVYHGRTAMLDVYTTRVDARLVSAVCVAPWTLK
ncbi:hypothetical protein C8J57DRAFT_1474307 [Mycena rebaudengoi]|nr:hypothetical protein C8J57DRAFT_1474307 [Mycena rebaudengoi]